MELNFFWFNLAKDGFALALALFAVWLVVRYLKSSSARDENVTVKGTIFRLTPAFIAVIMAVYNPVRLGVQDGAEENISRNYDSRPSQEEIVIDRHTVEKYNPSDNQEEIESITKED